MAGLKLPGAMALLCLVSSGALASSADDARNSASRPAANSSADTRAGPAAPPERTTATNAAAPSRPPNAAQPAQPESPAPSARHNGLAVDESGRPLPVSKGHQPPDASLFTPLAAIADVLGISALLSHLGMEGRVASAVGGILIILLLIVLVFLVWWRLMRRYHVTEMRQRRQTR